MSYRFIHLLTGLLLTASCSSLRDYKRGEWGAWKTKDCVNTRHHILKKRSMTTAQLKPGGCKVANGQWEDFYTGKTITMANFTTSGFWFNGSLRTTINTNLAGVMNLSGAGALALGADSVAAAPNPAGSLSFFEVVWLKEGSISEGDRLMVEGYLAHKHNLIGNLPATHPYKVVAP